MNRLTLFKILFKTQTAAGLAIGTQAVESVEKTHQDFTGAQIKFSRPDMRYSIWLLHVPRMFFLFYNAGRTVYNAGGTMVGRAGTQDQVVGFFLYHNAFVKWLHYQH